MNKKLTKLSLFLFTIHLFLGNFSAQTEQKAELVVQTGHTSDVTSVAFSPDGKMLASNSQSEWETKLWNVATGQELRTLDGGNAVFSPDGKTLFTSYLNKNTGILGIKLWNWQTGEELKFLQTDNNPAASASFSPKGDILSIITITPNTNIKLFDVITGIELRTLAGHLDAVTSTAFSPDGKKLASISEDKTIKIWNWQTGEQLMTTQVSSRGPIGRNIEFSPDGQTVSFSTFGGIKFLDAQTGREVKTTQYHSLFTTYSRVSPDWKFSVSFGSNGSNRENQDTESLIIGNVKTEQKLTTLNVKLNFGIGGQLADFTPDGKVIAVCLNNNPVLFDVTTGKKLQTFVGGAANSVASALSTNGDFLASGSSEGEIRLWNLELGQQTQTLTGHTSQIEIIAFSKDNKILASSDKDRTIKLWDLSIGKEIKSLLTKDPDTQKQVEAVVPEFYRSKKTLLTISDGKFYFSQNETGKININSAIDGKLFVSLISLGENEWVVITPDGLFDASPGARKLMHYIIGLEPISLEQMKDLYYVPNLLQKVLKGVVLPKVELFSKKDLFPDIDFSTPKAGQKDLPIELTNRGGGIGQVQILINGKEFVSDARPKGFDANTKKTTLTVSLKDAPLFDGEENKIEVVARNASGSLTNRGTPRGVEVFNLGGDAKQYTPNIYAIIGGVSNYTGDQLKLNFAAKDAEDFAKAVELGAVKLLSDKSKVHIRLLTSNGANSNVKFNVPDAKISTATKADVERAFNDFKNATPNDVFIVYLAGHGVSLNLNQNPEQAGGDTYLYLTQEATTTDKTVLSIENSRKAMTVSSDELKDLIKQNKALKQVLILDTCASGQAATSFVQKRDLPSDQIRAIERLKDNTGFYILMGSASDAASYEASQYGQGLLTYSLLQGMKGAKLKTDQTADVGLLFGYAAENVPQLAKNIGGIQQPRIITPDTSRDFPIGKFTIDEQKLISLSTLKPIFITPTLFNPAAKRDDMKLSKMLAEQLRQLSYISTRGEQSPFVFVETDEMVDGIQPSGSYIVEGDVLKISVILVKNNISVSKEIVVTGKMSELEKAIKQLVEMITKYGKVL